MGTKEIRLTRREMLKASGLGAVGIIAAACSPQENSPEYDQLRDFSLDNIRELNRESLHLTTWESDGSREENRSIFLREFEGEEAKIVQNLEQEFGVLVDSPLTWVVAGEEMVNLPWNLEELRALADAFAYLPPDYLNEAVRPREILLLKMARSDRQREAEYAHPVIIIQIPEDFQVEERLPPPIGAYIRTGRERLILDLLHEWSHAFTHAYPEIIDEWAEATGWSQTGRGQWINERHFEIFPWGGGQDHPNEDFATAVALMAINPEILSESRLTFFSTNPYFANWTAVPG